MTWLTTCAFPCLLPDNIPHLEVWSYLMVPNPRGIGYSDDVMFLFHPPHLLYHQFYYNCCCCERVNCLVRETGESESTDPASNSQLGQHSQTSLNRSKTGQEDLCDLVLLQGQQAHWLSQCYSIFHCGGDAIGKGCHPCQRYFSFGSFFFSSLNKQLLLSFGHWWRSISRTLETPVPKKLHHHS